LIAAAVFPCTGFAHRTDEYLHAAFIGIRLDHVVLQLSLTPGTAVAKAVLSEMDPDGDGRISTSEERAYSERVLRQIELRFDGVPIPLELQETRFPILENLREGMGIIELKARTPTNRFAPGRHELRLNNTHTVHSTVYLANALQPETSEIEILGQERNELQSELRIRFAIVASPIQVPLDEGARHPSPDWIFISSAVALGAVILRLIYRSPAR
jgi:hypothetical protein